MELHQRVLAAFHQRYGTDPDFVARAPGRVNLLGEHVDYNQGFVLPAAIDRVTLLAFRKSPSQRSTLLALDLGKDISFDQQSILVKQDANGAALPFWARYPTGVMWSLNTRGFEIPPIQAVYASDVPRGAGLSSSASVEMAFGVAWEKLGGWRLPPLEMAKVGLKAETQYVGLNCGIMDQFASACGIKDHLLFLDCRSLEWRSVRIPEQAVIVIADTSVRRSLKNSAYNQRHATCEQAVRILQEVLPGIQSLREVSLVDFHLHANRLPKIVAKRVQHIVEEIARTKKAVKLLENNNIVEFGLLMNACHASLRDLYEVSCPELDTMVELAQSQPGCYGARLTGAGFGGCTVNLVDRLAADSFSSKLTNDYTKETGLKPEIYICHAASGAGVV
jgi:galactokinase